MMKPTSTPRGKGPAKARRKTREEINQEARDRKRQKNTVVMRRVAVRPVAKAHLVAETKISKKILVLAAKTPFHWA